jgi:hypothetical protein
MDWGLGHQNKNAQVQSAGKSIDGKMFDKVIEYSSWMCIGWAVGLSQAGHIDDGIVSWFDDGMHHELCWCWSYYVYVVSAFRCCIE